MSSQSLNAATYSGYQLTPTATTGPPAVYTLYLSSIPLRDASDMTRMIRERARYNEFKSGNTVAPGNTENPWVPYGNAFRLSYLFGKLKCGSCTTGSPPYINGNAFAGNGPYVNNVGGKSAS